MPEPREAHVSQAIGDVMVIHGGLNHEETSFNDTWVLTGIDAKLDKLQSEINSFKYAQSLDGRPRRGGSRKEGKINEYLTWHECRQVG